MKLVLLFAVIGAIALVIVRSLRKAKKEVNQDNNFSQGGSGTILHSEDDASSSDKGEIKK